MKSNYIKTPTIYQMEATECGAASLSMIFAYFGKNLALEQMRIETGVSRDGCNAANIMRAAKKYGLECHGYRKELDGLMKLNPPCIIHWNFNHFVVYEGIKHGYAYLNDPAVGRRRLTIEELDEGFTGIVLTFSATESFEKEKKKNLFLRNITSRLKGQYSAIAKLVCLGILLVVPGVMLPLLSQFFLDDILSGGNVEWFSSFVILMLSVIILNCGLTFYRSIILQKLQNKMTLISAHKFLSHLFRLPVGFFDQRYAGDLSGRVVNNNNISSFLAGDLAETILNITVAGFYLILLLLYNPILTCIGVVNVAVEMIVLQCSSKTISDITVKLQQDQGKTMGTVCAGISITSTLKASGTENEYVSRILGNYAKNIMIEQKLNKLQNLLNIIPQISGSISTILVLMIGGIFVINGKMTIGMLVAFGTLLNSFTQPVTELVGIVRKVQTLKADMGRVEDIMNYPLDSKFENRDQIMIQTKLSGNVELKNVSFGYSRLSDPLVKNFGFKLSSGGSIALVGASGCGKSTVSKMISGLYQPWDGQILMDGVSLEKIPKSVISASISTVSQDITLFSGTIRDNLTMWNKGVLESDMIRAAKDACIHDVITAKPGAYDFYLAEGAANLSGGQRQRLEIARALTTNPSILIMDEATSALDPLVEKRILDNIKRRGCTCIIVAHRLSAIRDCDQILVMNRGKIEQRGTHEELALVDGLYQRLIKNL